MFVLQKIFVFIKADIVSHFSLFHINRIDYFKYLKSLSHFSFLVYFLSKPLMRLSQRGMLLLEMILMALFLGGIALSTAYYFTQTQATLTSSSQVNDCQSIVKNALEKTVSLGTRLYGYKINQGIHNLSYPPLFLDKDTGKSWDTTGNIKDVNDGSKIYFPPQHYRDLFKNLGLNVGAQNPKDNTGEFIIGNTYPYDISTSTLLVNSVNALQYLYNYDNTFFTGNSRKGKKYTINGMTSGKMSSIIKKYANRFDLEDVELYIKISPIDLQTNQPMTTSPPSQILTRPRFINNPKNHTPSPALNVLGDTNIGFEIRVRLKYKKEDQVYDCEASHRFTHQIKPLMETSTGLSVSLTGLKNGAGKDFLADTTLKNTSCDTDGTGYDDMNLTVDFSRMREGEQVGTIVLCRMNSYCRSYGKSGYGTCSPTEGLWQRCHDIKPKPSSDQSWTYKAKLKAPQELTMTFENMKPDRRYELEVGEFSIAGVNLKVKAVSKFYLDAKRPLITTVSITNDAVGTPTDRIGNRNYGGPATNWVKPPNSTRRWIQCNTNKVEFSGELTDQFTHNLNDCVFKGKRRNGTGTSTTSPTSTADCAGELTGIQHGRQTITFQPSDDCSHRPTPNSDLGTPKDLVWDTDLPTSFNPQNFPQNVYWYRNTARVPYSRSTLVPATGAGRFPKHYSVDCDENFLGTLTRQDGNSSTLSCRLQTSNSNNDDGCNPNELSVKYYHACGGPGVCKSTNWAVYAPQGESCQNVRCEPGSICCDGFRNECGSVSTKECETDSYTRSCSNPKGGGTSVQDTLSNCPPLGLYNCAYTLPCNATSPASMTGPTSACSGKRQGNNCSFTVAGTCNPNAGTGWRSSPPSTSGTCNLNGTSYTKPCTADSVSRCTNPCTHYNCTRCSTCTRTVPCVPPETCTTKTESYPCNCTYNNFCNHGCHGTWQYRATTKPCSQTFSGSCGTPSGSCSRKGFGGGNLSLEKCTERPSSATCGPATPPPAPKCGTYHGTKCVEGTMSNLADAGTRYTWQCMNANGITKNCVHNKCTCGTCPNTGCTTGDPEDGVCSGNGCSVGTRQPATGSPWICKGVDGGNDSATCPAANSPEDGECFKNGCKKGTRTPATGSPWICKGLNGGKDSGQCPAPTQDPEDGVCSGNGCSVGTRDPATGNSWKCKGVNGGSDSATCPAAGTPENGECYQSGCKKGTRTPASGKPWTCRGLHGGSNSPTCPINGLCSDNGCTRGTKNNLSGGQWECQGIGTGTTDGPCGIACSATDCTEKCCEKNNCCPSDCSCSGNGCSGCTATNPGNQELQNANGIIHNRFTHTCGTKSCVAELRSCTRSQVMPGDPIDQDPDDDGNTVNNVPQFVSCSVYRNSEDGQVYDSNTFCSKTAHGITVECSL